MTGMGVSTGRATIFYCVALSMVAAAAATQVPPTEADSVSAAEFVSSALKADTLPSSSRKLLGAGDAPLGNRTVPRPHTGISSDTRECGVGVWLAVPMCPVRFDKMKGPAIEVGKKCKTTGVKVCCDAFKAFACPHSKLLNDLSNGCADDMFYFIQTYGQLPPGTIFKKCLEGPHGLKC
uniref:GPI-anchored protein LLG1-like domain-containing protein n=1 Tax=Oryza punctata TaxID=4537 RepID=A0A0E0KSE1_ORYPU